MWRDVFLQNQTLAQADVPTLGCLHHTRYCTCRGCPMEEEQKRVHQNTGLTQVLPTAVLTRRLGEKGKKKNKETCLQLSFLFALTGFSSLIAFFFFFFKGNMAIFSSCFLSWSLKNENSLFIPYV